VILIAPRLPAPIDLHLRPVTAVVAVLAGVALGAAFGRLTRRLVRILPRILFGAVTAAALWLLSYAFVLMRVAPQLASAIPFTSSALCALAYGACTGAIPPTRTRTERGRKV
jgi:hypothetical protein